MEYKEQDTYSNYKSPYKNQMNESGPGAFSVQRRHSNQLSLISDESPCKIS